MDITKERLLKYKKQSKDEKPKGLRLKEIAYMMRSLSSPIRLKIMEEVVNHPNKEYVISDFEKMIDRSTSSTFMQVKRLELCGFIQNYLRKDEKQDNCYSFFQITELGKQMMDVIIKGYNGYFDATTQKGKDEDEEVIKVCDWCGEEVYSTRCMHCNKEFTVETYNKLKTK